MKFLKLLIIKWRPFEFLEKMCFLSPFCYVTKYINEMILLLIGRMDENLFSESFHRPLLKLFYI